MGTFRQGMCLLLLVCELAGCVSAETQSDGSTKLHVSLAQALGIPPTAGKRQGGEEANSSRPATPSTPGQPSAGTIAHTALSGIFSTHPFDGMSQTYFPRVAVTVTNWSRTDCWAAFARIWWTRTKSEVVPGFTVCWPHSLGFSVNNAASLHQFLEQSSPFEQSGNIRTEGPKPPMMAVPNQTAPGNDDQNAFSGFVEQLVVDTGWQAGAPTNMWIVAYNKNATPINSPAPSSGATGHVSSDLQRLYECGETTETYLAKQKALGIRPMKATLDAQGHWHPSIESVAAAPRVPLTVFGLPMSKSAAVTNSQSGNTQTSYASVFSDTSDAGRQRLVQAAQLTPADSDDESFVGQMIRKVQWQDGGAESAVLSLQKAPTALMLVCTYFQAGSDY